MLIRKPADLRFSDVTPRNLYVNRRRFLAAGSAALGSLALPAPGRAAGAKIPNVVKSNYKVDEKINSYEDITTYNNYYEFGTDKSEPAHYANTLKPSPWQIVVGGLVNKPKTFDLDAIMKLAPLEERVYRHRCVEAWSMVIPWVGFPLSDLIKKAEPTSKAKFVEFTTLADYGQMPGIRQPVLQWPYTEGLRMDEAMHPLTIIAVGLYGEVLPKQNGAPIRLVVPWKYGYKSIKSIVRIRLVEKEPPTTWGAYNSREYGFYSNVNPEVDHPRWSQKEKQRLGSGFLGQGTRMPTVKFNGYGAQVASLYTGMDLVKNH